MAKSKQPHPVSVHINCELGRLALSTCLRHHEMTVGLKQSSPHLKPCCMPADHPDKHDRQNAVMKYYIEGDEHALDRFPGGSEPGT